MLYKILSATTRPMLDQVSLAPVSEYSRKPSVFYEIKELWAFGPKTIIIFKFKYWECFPVLVGQNLGLKCNRRKIYFDTIGCCLRALFMEKALEIFLLQCPLCFLAAMCQTHRQHLIFLCVFPTWDTLGIPMTIVFWSPPFL